MAMTPEQKQLVKNTWKQVTPIADIAAEISVGAALLWALEQGLGQVWTPEVASAWTEVYGLLSGIMRKAAAQADIAAVKHVAVLSPAREAALG
jgi:hypothetical protein